MVLLHQDVINHMLMKTDRHSQEYPVIDGLILPCCNDSSKICKCNFIKSFMTVMLHGYHGM